MPRYCVIGAGASGLSALKALIEHGFEVDCFERQDDVGGNWYFGSQHSNMYASATMISSKRLTEFPDFRMPREFPHYPSHEQAFAYLRGYADRFQLRPRICFNSPVRNVESGPKGWRVRLANEAKTRHYDGVVVASGHHSEPNIPDEVAGFSGDMIHSRDYRVPHSFDGKRVLVIGAGNSGCDIAAELGRHAEHTSISLRRGYHFLPKFLCGAPLDRCGETMARFRLPWFLYRAITGALLRVAVGPPEKYGLPRPAGRLFESHPIVNSQLLQEVGHGRVEVRPAVQSIDGDMVKFADGKTAEFDVLLCATGYRLSWPFLAASHDIEGSAGKLPLRIFHPEFNGLFFAGLIQPNGGIWPLADLQARLIAKYLVAREQSSSHSCSKLQGFIGRIGPRAITGGIRYGPSSRHELEVEYFAYRRTLQQLLGRCDALGLGPTSSPAAVDQVEESLLDLPLRP